jgi:hypothetical protein
MKVKLLIIAFSPLHRDPRVHRQIVFLQDHNIFDITTAGYTASKMPDLNFVRIELAERKNIKDKLLTGIKLKLGFFEKYYWNNDSVISAISQLKGFDFDIIIANDINTLPVALYLAKSNGAKVLIDCHEYTPREYDDQFKFSFFFKKYWDYICRTFLPKADMFTTVCGTIADEYQKNYGGDWEVITNAPFYADLNPKPVENNKIRIIHHGGLNPTRNIEKMIKLIDLLDDRFKLDFMFVNSDPGYLSKLKIIAKNNSRICFRDPVPMTEIARTINHYDIGLYLLPPAGFNNQMALPNKFFEFIQARLALAIWPSPEMAKITKEYNCGVVSDDFSVKSMAKTMNALTSEDIMHYKMNSDKAAVSLCAEKNGEILNRLVSTLLS